MEINFSGKNRKIYDISPLISEKIAAFPGDVSYSRRSSRSFARGDTYELSAITTSVHVGAHVDAPVHYHQTGEGIDSRSLEYYLGPCQVLAPTLAQGEGISLAHLAGLQIKAPRLLFKTGSFPDPQKWRDDFCFISPEVVSYLATQQVILLGIDTPSLDPSTATELSSHHLVYQYNMAILEGIDLSQVVPGMYELIALPLRLEGADASPVRAILLG